MAVSGSIKMIKESKNVKGKNPTKNRKQPLRVVGFQTSHVAKS